MSQEENSKTLIVGSVAFDTIHNVHGKHERIVGGSAYYASLASATFGPSRLVAVAGDDFPEQARQTLRSQKVCLEGLEIVDGKTFFWEGRYSDDFSSRETLATELNVFAEFRPKIPTAYQDTPYVMLGNIDPELQLDVLEQIKRPKFVIADTMNFWIDIKLDALKKMISRIHLLVVNEEEARQLASEHNLVRAGKYLRGLGPQYVVIKRGEYGSMLFGPDDLFDASAFPVLDVQDPTGAGDTFAGGLLGYVAEQDSVDVEVLRKAIMYGTAVASHCVQAIGVDGVKDLTRTQINGRFEELRTLTAF